MFNVQRAITPNVGKPEFMCFARRLIVLYSCVKFRENITNSFRVMELTLVHGRNGYVQCSKGNNSKSMQTTVTVHVLHIGSWCFTFVFCICVKFRENISNGSELWSRLEIMKH